MIKTVTFQTSSPEETISLGVRIGSLLLEGDVVSLTGDLGSGKTVLVRGICRPLGCDESVKSPSYTLVREYEGDLPVFHIDLYRLRGTGDWNGLGVDDRMEEGITLVEWGERAEEVLPERTMTVEIEAGRGECDRNYRIRWADSRIDRLGAGE